MKTSRGLTAVLLCCVAGCADSRTAPPSDEAVRERGPERRADVADAEQPEPAAAPLVDPSHRPVAAPRPERKKELLEWLLRRSGPETATFPSSEQVRRIVVRGTESSPDFGDPEPAPLAEITDPGRIAEVLSFLHQYRDEWAPVPWTPPSGTVQVTFYDDRAKFLRVVRLGGHGSLQGPLSRDRSGEYFKNLPDGELNRFMELLSLDPSDKTIRGLLALEGVR